MAITKVGTVQPGSAIDGGDVTLTFDGTPAEDDFVVVIGTIGNVGGNSAEPDGPNTAGYTEQAHIGSSTSRKSNLGIWTKFLGSTPDSDVVCEGHGDAQDGVTYISIVLRGVDLTTPLDVAVVGPASTDTTNDPQTDAITTVTNGAWVGSLLGNALDSSEPNGFPSGYTDTAQVRANDHTDSQSVMAWKEIATAGLETPGAFSIVGNGWGGTDPAWYGFTIAIRPAVAAALPPPYGQQVYHQDDDIQGQEQVFT